MNLNTAPVSTTILPDLVIPLPHPLLYIIVPIITAPRVCTSVPFILLSHAQLILLVNHIAIQFAKLGHVMNWAGRK